MSLCSKNLNKLKKSPTLLKYRSVAKSQSTLLPSKLERQTIQRVTFYLRRNPEAETSMWGRYGVQVWTCWIWDAVRFPSTDFVKTVSYMSYRYVVYKNEEVFYTYPLIFFLMNQIQYYPFFSINVYSPSMFTNLHCVKYFYNLFFITCMVL